MYAALCDLGCTISLIKFDVSEDGKATMSANTVGGVGRTMMFGGKTILTSLPRIRRV